ncbi:unnamed protein product [Medioppia subpectinata]|uniref:chitin synthase n=1 Tax=Medioppia subpectinata TaxID=1979941 RepID=A0A7R9PU33_9ACAR|nr:unnamed protein product [Medioppia subpectinata]CAG2101348.1 unnamed protein product [Medioppia subpectinata]
MDRTQNIELTNLNHNNNNNNKFSYTNNAMSSVNRSDSNPDEVVLRRSRNSDMTGEGVTFKNTGFGHTNNDLKMDNIELEAEDFDSLFNGPRKDSEELKAWDRFKTLPPPDEDETLDGEWVMVFIKWLKLFAYFFTFVVTLGCAVLSKSLIFLMISMTKVGLKIPLCNDDIYEVDKPLESDKRYTVIYHENDPERVAWLWVLFFAVITPEVFAWGRSARICYFKTYQVPSLQTFLTVFTTETLNAIGISLLVFSILPTIDVIKGVMITNGLCFIPGILLILSNTDKNSKLNLLLTYTATVFQLLGFVLWPLVVHHDDSNQYWYIPIAMICVSFQWWENFIDPQSDNAFNKWLLKSKNDLVKSRYFTYFIITIWKIVVILSFMILLEYVNNGSDSVKSLFTRFSDGFNNQDIKVFRDKSQLEFQQAIEGESLTMSVSDPYVAVWILLIQIALTYTCYAVGKFSCKICIQGFSFAVPVNLSVPMTVSFLWAVISAAAQDKCAVSNGFFNGFQYIFWYTTEVDAFAYEKELFNYVSTIMWVLSLASQIWISIHIWFSTSERLASTEKLFLIPMYSSVIVDQSLAMNRRRIDIIDKVVVDEEATEAEKLAKPLMADKTMNHLYESVNEAVPAVPSVPDNDETIRIFVCATMWHEDRNEMVQMLKAVMRLDADQCARRQAHQFFNIHPSLTDYYEIEFNIFFDDAFDQGPSDDEDDRLVNRFVKQLIDTMDEAASNVHETVIVLKRPDVVPTPYGGKLEWMLPGQNKLVAHLKDKILIRHRKRWSQCMYMYYLLGHRIVERPIDEARKETIAMNTFVLALDGDINFRPHALHLVVDLMKKNKKLGAACGRIHPIGGGPMVWYQKFEYAIGHWLQKATEHAFGCVLCSPGCFSLFRARAVMDDSVMNKYTTPPSEALHYVQYDQGEDRWLCTLMLQQGWRIEYCAASDSYTHAPEAFGDFYTQRRRWAPSTMANIMDLLGDYKRTVACNTDISKPYIIYQGMLMVGTILSPATIFLMIVGAMNTVLGLNSWAALGCNIAPVLTFSIVCMTVKKNDHIIFYAMILSVLYALLMLAVLVGTGIDIFTKGILTPNSIFFVSLMGSFVLAACLHPQEFACVLPLPLYMLLIPSMYLLLTIYSVTNMHIVSWGTREVKSKLTAKEAAMAAEAAAEEEAEKAKKGNLFGKLDFSKLGSKAGLFTCMCCSSNRSDEDSAKLSEIREQLNRVNDNVATIKHSVEIPDNQSRRGTVQYRRQSSSAKHSVGGDVGGLSTIHGGQTDEEDGDDDRSSDSQSAFIEEKLRSPSIADSMVASKPRWCRDPTFKKFPLVPLKDNELQFWQDFIPKYLLPLDENPKEQKRIAADLIDLRNKMVFAFAIMNTIFILFVLLLQMHGDVFNFEIEAGIDYWNKTRYIDEEERWEMTPVYRYMKMDPIGMFLVVFFGAILVIQMIGMFMHRFGTLAHLLAFTSIDFCSKEADDDDEETALNKNAVNIVKQFQKLKGMEEYDDPNAGSATTNLPGNRKSMWKKEPKPDAEPLNLDAAFRRRIMSLRPDSIEAPMGANGPRKSILKRQSTFQAIRRRRDTMINDENRRLSQMSIDPNDSTIGSNQRPVSWLLNPPKTSFDMRNSQLNQSNRSSQYNPNR